jgi:acetylornithine deacetylase/succinyl-diaminopimelate desuccinylase-like protein
MRIYARSASDDKAGVDAILNAYDAINKSGLKPTYNLKFFEGEEEEGSTHLDAILENTTVAVRFMGNVMALCINNQAKQIYFGVRGANLDLTVYAKRPLHSGHYGN